MDAPPPPELTPLEIASGLVFGLDPDRLPHTSLTAVEALERSILPALVRAPCLVSFSGGRDSSSVLALAARVARREGLPLPIPATNRFPLAPESHEDEWQEHVIAHLGLEEWIRLEHRSELDLVGPWARRALLRHGLLWPFNSHFHLPILEAARGGSVLTGIFGDELLGYTNWQRQLDLLRGRVRPEPRDLLRLLSFSAPRVLRRLYLGRTLPVAYSWLRPAARRQIAKLWAAEQATEPRRARAHMRWRGRHRYQRVGNASIQLLAADHEVLLVHPFADPTFRSALVRTPFIDRTDAFRGLLGDVLPDEVLARRTKSGFDDAFFAEHSRAFADTWDGRGVDEELVDPEVLAAEWRSQAPDARSFLLLQAAWLETSSRQSGKQDIDRTSEGAPVPRPA